jgi:uncharacterized membrane protein YeaQ/YmgE (transglycosylase-associated protein family)
MEMVTWVILGMVSGGLVASILENDQYVARYIDVVLGVIGAVVAGIIATIFSMQHVAGVYDETILLSVVGAGILIWVGRKVFVKKL